MNIKKFIRILIITACLLLIPFIAMHFTNEVQWTVSDFIFAAVVFICTGVAYEFLASRSRNTRYQVAAAIDVLTSLALIWVTGAVAIIGDENPANLFYLGVIGVALIGATLARFEARKMSVALFATAIAQAIIPIIAIIAWPGDFSPGIARVFVLNSGFVVAYLVSGILFYQSSSDSKSVSRRLA